MTTILLIALACLALSLTIAYLLIQRSKWLLGGLLGLLPIGLMVVLSTRSLDASVQRCLDSLCESAGLPPGCGLVELGCNEWVGLGYALFWFAGILDFVLYGIGLVIIAVVRSRRRPPADTTEGELG